MTKLSEVFPPELKKVFCDYCHQEAELVTSAEIYHGVDYGTMCYRCVPCGAHVGCHKGTTEPLGRLANAELRIWKRKVHALFDPLWNKKLEVRRQQRGSFYPKAQARGSMYYWLARKLNIPREHCHIGMFDVETCKRAVSICEEGMAKLEANDFRTSNKPG